MEAEHDPEEVPARLREVLADALAGQRVDAVAGRVARLVEAYRSGERPGAMILADEGDVRAYAAYRMPATVAALRSALTQTYDAIPALSAAHLVDLGGGTGATSWAVASLDGTLREVDVLEQSPAARRLGADLGDRSGIPVLRDARWHGWRLGGTVPARLEGAEADLAVVSYVVGELGEDDQRAIVRLAARLATTVLVVEPGTPAGYRRVLAARAELQALGLTIAAPCPHQRACPLQDDDWCHFPARVERSALHRAVKGGELDHEDEKFSYVAATRLPVDPGRGRVLRHPLVRKGLVGLPLCLPDGTTAQRLVSKKQGESYRRARKTGWGDELR